MLRLRNDGKSEKQDYAAQSSSGHTPAEGVSVGNRGRLILEQICASLISCITS